MISSSRIVDRLEGIMRKFGERVVKDRFEIVKYVGDDWAVEIFWEGKDGISRNIIVMVARGGSYWLNPEINAWKDDLDKLERRWRHWAGAYSVPVNSADFSEEEIIEIILMFIQTYEMVQRATEDNLIWTGKLQPDPRG